MIVNIEVMLLYMITLFLMLFFGLITYKIMNNMKMGFIFGELFILCLTFLVLPPVLGVLQTTTVMYIIGFLLVLGSGLVAKVVWNTPGMMMMVQISVAGGLFFIFSGVFGIVG